MPGERHLDAVVVGAGFAGLYMLHRLRGLGFSARVFEAGDGVGGTWYWNRYPGARCDVESMDYSYSFSDELQQEWTWSERYAAQPEILRYINHVADRFDLRRDIQLSTRVTSATFDEATGRWTVETDRGDRVWARFCVMATGCLSTTQVPRIPGLEAFRGPRYHTGHWPHEGVDFTGRRVGVIGTGSSAIQSIPIIAEQATHLFVFQRTPNFSIPAHNAPLDREFERRVKAGYAEFRRQARESRVGFVVERSDDSALAVTADERRREYEKRWRRGGLGFTATFADLLINPKANETAAEFCREKIREVVRDPAVAEVLVPQDYPVGTKRMCVDTRYYETFNRPNVRLVDISNGGIEAITATGVRAGDEDHALDAIVFATGFDAMTGALARIRFEGVGGRTLTEAWGEGPRTYLGLAVAGFPNLFVITGPGSPSVLTNMVTSIEQHVEWITACLEHLRAGGHATIEADPGAVENWVAYVNRVAGLTLFPTCNSWYLGANIPGKPRVFMPLPGFPPYEAMCANVAVQGYQGFVIDRARVPS